MSEVIKVETRSVCLHICMFHLRQRAKNKNSIGLVAFEKLYQVLINFSIVFFSINEEKQY